MRLPTTPRARVGALTATLLLAGTLTACGGHSGMSGMDHASPSRSTTGMPGMADMPTGDGLSAQSQGYQLTAASGATLPANQPATFTYRIQSPAGTPLTAYRPDQTKLMHFYAIRSDLTGFQHVHPTMAKDGTWTATLSALTPGTYRLYTSFTPNTGPAAGKTLVLSLPATVPGSAGNQPLPAPSSTATVDGYTVTVDGTPMAGMPHPLTVTVSRAGKPVTDLQPYLDSYAHLTAFRSTTLAFAHLHPEGKADNNHGGPKLTFHAEVPTAGDWRLFLQFQTSGTLHTAALTMHVTG